MPTNKAVNKTINVQGWAFFGLTDYPVHVTPKRNLGVLDKDAIRAFSRGQCHSFAYQMNKETQWPMIGVGDYGGSPNHLLVYVPHLDDYLDIRGLGAMRRRPDAEEMVQELSSSMIEKGLEGYLPLNIYAAKPFVKSMLNRIKRLPATVKKPIHKDWRGIANKPLYGYDHIEDRMPLINA